MNINSILFPVILVIGSPEEVVGISGCRPIFVGGGATQKNKLEA